MVIIARVSRGSQMDQIYIPKNRAGFEVGGYVEINPLTKELRNKKEERKLYFYKVKKIEPIKVEIINRIIWIIENNIENDNIIFTGSFLDQGFEFQDLDIIVISDKKVDINYLENSIAKKIGIKMHIIMLDNDSLMGGLSSDPLYQMMLSKCVAKKKFIYKSNKKINYKILDLHLLKSKILVDNFDILTGREKYYLIRNIMSIYLFIKGKDINRTNLEREIKNIFKVDITKIKNNMLDENKFLKKYKAIYKEIFELIMRHAKNGAK